MGKGHSSNKMRQRSRRRKMKNRVARHADDIKRWRKLFQNAKVSGDTLPLRPWAKRCLDGGGELVKPPASWTCMAKVRGYDYRGRSVIETCLAENNGRREKCRKCKANRPK